jgi:MHS family proline/betaine transporter-like MFS transporter
MHNNQNRLSTEQKEAMGLLSIGTFLEYFDLMLYVHMAVLLNELFFPITDPMTTSLLAAFAFCSTFVFRPIGALIFGYIGDNIGRKSTITITTFLMAGCCFVIALLPTYAEIGLAASVLITICRMVQGMSSMGEIIGAELYITEITKPPFQYAAVTLIAAFANMGTIFALLISTLITSYGLNWRYAFEFGLIIAMIGGLARQRLRETPDFVDAKRRIKNRIAECGGDSDRIDSNPIVLEKVNRKTAVYLFCMDCGWPVVFYITYFYCTNILRDVFHYSAADIIQHNLIIASVNFLERLVLSYLSYRVYPLKILKYKSIVFSCLILLTPYLLNNATSASHVLLIQLLIIIFGCTTLPAVPTIYKHLPVFKRFTCASLTYALSTAVIYVITSFGLIYCTMYLGHFGILIITIPMITAFMLGIMHFEGLEKAVGAYPQKHTTSGSGSA